MEQQHAVIFRFAADAPGTEEQISILLAVIAVRQVVYRDHDDLRAGAILLERAVDVEDELARALRERAGLVVDVEVVPRAGVGYVRGEDREGEDGDGEQQSYNTFFHMRLSLS